MKKMDICSATLKDDSEGAGAGERQWMRRARLVWEMDAETSVGGDRDAREPTGYGDNVVVYQ